jgi:hypothetical protein
MSMMGHSRPSHSAPVSANVRCYSNSGHSRHESELAGALEAIEKVERALSNAIADGIKPELRKAHWTLLAAVEGVEVRETFGNR